MTPETKERRVRVLYLRQTGRTFAQMGEVLGVSTGRARQLYVEALKYVGRGWRGWCLQRRSLCRISGFKDDNYGIWHCCTPEDPEGEYRFYP